MFTAQFTIDGLIGIAASIFIYALGRFDGRRQNKIAADQRLKDAQGILESIELELKRMYRYVVRRETREYKPRVISALYPYAKTLPPLLFRNIDLAYHLYEPGSVVRDNVAASLRYVEAEIRLYLDKNEKPVAALKDVMDGNGIDIDSPAAIKWKTLLQEEKEKAIAIRG